jgi:pyruvate dehydrogenase E1 component alpha subunit
MPIALGSALSASLLCNGKVTICFHGDGGTNQGVWHETINMAATWNLPVVFLIENNQMAIGTELQCASKETDLYRRAPGYGIPGVLVDGFNVFEVYQAAKEAVDRARSGGGPTLIEARFLRLLGHFVADDQWYRDMTKVEPYWDMDPIKRMKEFLVLNKSLDEGEIARIEEKAKSDVERAVAYASTECTEPGKDTLYEDIYAHGEVIV